MKLKYFILLLIILLSSFLRLYKINSVPPSASLDEATIGWNAYSILNTGKDEYGYKFPILLRAYDDWRPALYVYTVIPFVKIFGLNILSVRLPSAIFSFLTIVTSYFLVKNLFIKYKYSEHIALISTFLLGISPWNIYISRLGHEANPGLFFAVLGITLFIVFLKNPEKKWSIILSFISFSFALYTYQSEKIFVPLILLTFFILFYKTLIKFKKLTLLAITVFFILSVPIISVSFSKDALVRLKGTSAFDINQPIYTQNFIKLQEAKKKGDPLGQVVFQRKITDLKIFLSQYFSHFNPYWLFGNSGSDSFKALKVGLFNLWVLPFMVAGIYLLFTKHKDNRIKYPLFMWVLISFLPSAITTGAPHAIRSYNLLPAPQILAAFGIVL